MRTHANRIQLIMAAMWLTSFAVCMLSVLFIWQDVPKQREPFLKNAFEAFAPGLGVMLAAFFVKPSSKTKATKAEHSSWEKTMGLLALVLASLYLMVFDVTVIRFFAGGIDNLETVNTIFSTARPFTSWLVVPVIAYYFGKKPD